MVANRIGQITGLLRRTKDAKPPTSRARRPTRRFSVGSGIEGLEERLVLSGTAPIDNKMVITYSITTYPTSTGTVVGYPSTSTTRPISTSTSTSTAPK
jgi:hypothetical protein